MERKSVGIFILNKKKEVLLQLRDNKEGIDYPGYWGIIGGEINNGESDLDAIKREIKEEINIIIQKIKFISKLNIKRSNLTLKDTEISIFKGETDMPISEIIIKEGQKIKFFNLNEINNPKIISILKDYILKNKKSIFD